MCLFAAVYRVVPGCPVLLLANREESRSRPTQSPSFHQDGPDDLVWLGGIDLQAGGTWLGINTDGLMVAVTNRSKRDVADTVRSRGLLCRDLLAQESATAALEELHRQLRRNEFDGFNLIVIDSLRAVVVESDDALVTTELTAGIHAVANGSLNDPGDPRIRRAQRELKRAVVTADDIDELCTEIERIGGLGADGDQPAICHTGSEWGTVSSTVIAISDPPRDSRYRYASGPPDQTAFEDYSPRIRDLLIHQPQD